MRESVAHRAYQANHIELNALFPQVFDHAFQHNQGGAVDTVYGLGVQYHRLQRTLGPLLYKAVKARFEIILVGKIQRRVKAEDQQIFAYANTLESMNVAVQVFAVELA